VSDRKHDNSFQTSFLLDGKERDLSTFSLGKNCSCQCVKTEKERKGGGFLHYKKKFIIYINYYYYYHHHNND
jgi:hypothetical protein